MITEKNNLPARIGRPPALDTPLARLRAEGALTLRRVAEMVNDIEPTLTADHGKLQYVEENGTYDVRWIKALARVYDRTNEEMEAVCRHSREL